MFKLKHLCICLLNMFSLVVFVLPATHGIEGYNLLSIETLMKRYLIIHNY